MLKIKLEGYKEAAEILFQLPIELQKKIVKPSLRVSAKPMLMMAQNLAPKKSGTLAKSLKLFTANRKMNKAESAVIIKHDFDKIILGYSRGKPNQYYGLMQHEGTTDIRISPKKDKKGKRKMLVFPGRNGKMIFTRSVQGLPPTRYIDKAYDRQESQLINSFGDNLQKSVERFVSRKFKLTR